MQIFLIIKKQKLIGKVHNIVVQRFPRLLLGLLTDQERQDGGRFGLVPSPLHPLGQPVELNIDAPPPSVSHQ